MRTMLSFLMAAALLAGCSYPAPAPMPVASAQRATMTAGQPASTNLTILVSTSLNDPQWVSVTLTNYPIDLYQHVAFDPNGADGYLIRVDGSQVFDVGTNTSPVLNGLTPGQHVYQAACYLGSLTSQFSNPVTGTAIAKYDENQAVFIKTPDNKVLKLTIQ